LSDPVRNVQSELRFDGPVYSQEHDGIRLTGQIQRIFSLMKDEHWRTLNEIAETTGDPPASVSAQLRHLRKVRFGKHTILKRHRGNVKSGLWEYQLLVSFSTELPFELEDSKLEYFDDCVKLKCHVPKDEWIKIHKRLEKKDYKYQGYGKWIKEKQK